MPVCKGIFMSMCLPPLFAPCEMNGKVYVDGGILQNYPMQAFEGFEKSTIGFSVKWGLCNTLDSFENYFSRLTYCTLSAASKAQFQALSDDLKDHTINIDCGDVSTMHWRVPAGTALAMEARGRESVRDFVRRFNMRALPLEKKTLVRPAMVTSATQTGEEPADEAPAQDQKNVGDQVKEKVGSA